MSCRGGGSRRHFSPNPVRLVGPGELFRLRGCFSPQSDPAGRLGEICRSVTNSPNLERRAGLGELLALSERNSPEPVGARRFGALVTSTPAGTHPARRPSRLLRCKNVLHKTSVPRYEVGTAFSPGLAWNRGFAPVINATNPSARGDPSTFLTLSAQNPPRPVGGMRFVALVTSIRPELTSAERPVPHPSMQKRPQPAAPSTPAQALLVQRQLVDRDLVDPVEVRDPQQVVAVFRPGGGQLHV
jgi:hypothetical protein